MYRYIGPLLLAFVGVGLIATGPGAFFGIPLLAAAAAWAAVQALTGAAK